MSEFTHLHVHSHYSMLDGLPKIEEILDHVEKNNMDAVALTDHGVLYGLVEFYQKAKERGIKPILGVEAYVAPNGMKNKRSKADKKNYHLTLLCENNEGYHNLIKLISKAHLEGFYYKPRIDLETLEDYAEGLIGLSGCIQGEIPQLVVSGNKQKAKKKAKEYNQIFGQGNFYLELQHHPGNAEQDKANEGLKEISKKEGIPLVATRDSHYLKKEDDKTQDILVAIQTGATIHDEDRLTVEDYDLSMCPPEEMKEHFQDTPEAIKNTQRIKEKCEVELDFDSIHLPNFEVPEGETAHSYLKKLIKEGVEERYGEIETLKNERPEFLKKIKQRLKKELSVIKETGYSSYFLIVQDFVNWAKEQGIVVGPGRGSAAGSLVSYLINITNVDPLKHGLIFERFLNPKRVSMPDIDIDFADDRRDEVIEYSRQKYGEDHVAQIITFGKIAARMAVRDVGRSLGYSYDFCDVIAKLIPFGDTIEEALEETPELKTRYKEEEKVKKLIDFSKQLEGVARHASTHACGVVITREPLTEYVPLQRASSDDESIVTQYEMHAIEDLGLLKMDFLGLKNLTIIQRTLDIVENTRGKEVDIEEVPQDDKKAFEVFQKGATSGIFQFESRGMKRYLKQLEPSEFDDLVAMVALYRPGPMELIPDYIKRKHGEEEIEYVHPDLEPILKDTYGIAVYQEQLLEIARQLGGFSYGEADVLRKAIGKKIASLLEEQKNKLIKGLKENGIEQEAAEKIWEFVEPFARYGFNRSHAASYATIAYQTAYLKAHFSVEFMASLLTAEDDDVDEIAFLVDEAERMGIEVLPPDINESLKDFTVSKVEPPKIRFGLSAIKHVGDNLIKAIIKERKENGPFEDMPDFVERITHKDLNKGSLEALIKVGAFDNLDHRGKLLENLERLLEASKEAAQRQQNGQTSLFDKKEVTHSITLQDAPKPPDDQKLNWEKKLLGLYLSSHPLENHAEKIKEERSHTLTELDQDTRGKVKTGGILSEVNEIRTKNDNLMAFATLESQTAEIELVIFPSVYSKDKSIWTEDNVVIIEGKTQKRENEEEAKLIVEKVEKVN